MPYDVMISGRDLPVAARLMEALTTAGLLKSGITWEDLPDKIILHVTSDPLTVNQRRSRAPKKSVS